MASSGSTSGAVGQRRARAGVEEVERHLGGVDLAQLAEQLEALVDGLAHAEQGAAAQLHAVLAHQPAGVEPLVPVWVVTTCGKNERAVSRLWL